MLTATIRSAVELSATQVAEVKKVLTKKYGKDIEIKEVIDTSLIGGVQLVIGSQMLDGSVRSKIQLLKHSLQQHSY
jgi:F-type H+-transporting ATPase subunit delta